MVPRDKRAWDGSRVRRLHSLQHPLDRGEAPRGVVGMTSAPRGSGRPRRATRSPRTGDPDLDNELRKILDDIGVERDRDVLLEILVSAVRLAQDHPDRLDLKITSATLKE